jgi:hypothetical protein
MDSLPRCRPNAFHLLIGLVMTIPQAAIAEGHLELARALLTEVSPDRNSYAYRGWVRWKGDKTLFFEASATEVHADCSGLMDALLDRVHSKTLDIIKSNTYWKSYPKAENYYQAISEGLGFERRVDLAAIEPGDIIAIKYTGTTDTGHVMMVDAAPEPIEASNPVLTGTRQWSVAIIDSSPSPHGESDTRFATKSTGIGRGELRIYSDMNGVPVGYTWGINKTKY